MTFEQFSKEVREHFKTRGRVVLALRDLLSSKRVSHVSVNVDKGDRILSEYDEHCKAGAHTPDTFLAKAKEIFEESAPLLAAA